MDDSVKDPMDYTRRPQSTGAHMVLAMMVAEQVGYA